METMTVVLELTKETKNTFKYQEVSSSDAPPSIENIYIKKYKIGKKPPKQIQVVITTVE